MHHKKLVFHSNNKTHDTGSHMISSHTTHEQNDIWQWTHLFNHDFI